LGPSHEALFEPYELEGKVIFNKFKKPILLFPVRKGPFFVEQALTDWPCDASQVREASLGFSKAYEDVFCHFVHY
jgi:hypothetical protein